MSCFSFLAIIKKKKKSGISFHPRKVSKPKKLMDFREAQKEIKNRLQQISSLS